MSSPITHSKPKQTAAVPRPVRTRRHLWLAAHAEEYFSRGSHALALPLAYDRLVRAYQTPEQRQAEGRSQGWARMLEGALLRGEAKLEAAQAGGAVTADTADAAERRGQRKAGHGHGSGGGKTGAKALKALPGEVEDDEGEGEDEADGKHEARRRGQGLGSASTDEGRLDGFTDTKWDMPLGIAPAEEILDTSPEREVEVNGSGDGTNSAARAGVVLDGIDEAMALARWRELLTQRFVSGDDEDIDYEAVDSDRDLDGGWQELQRQQDWFEDETEAWEDSSDAERPLKGETGIQDF